MSDKTPFDPAQNAQNAASYLDGQLNQIAKPGDQAFLAADESLQALQAASIPDSMKAQVHTDLLKMDPNADTTLKKYFPDFQLTGTGDNQVMQAKDANPSQDGGAGVLRNVAMEMAGQVLSTGQINADGKQILANYASASAQDYAASYVNTELQALGITNEKLGYADKAPGLIGKLEQAADPTSWVGVKGEYDMVDANGKKLETVQTYKEQTPNEMGTYVRVGDSMVATPGHALTYTYNPSSDSSNQ